MASALALGRWVLVLRCIWLSPAGALDERPPDRSPLTNLYRILLGGGDGEAKTALVPTRLVGAGFGRTGTSSLLAALKELGYNPYHMAEGVLDLGHEKAWVRVADAWLAEDEKEREVATDAVIDLIAGNGFDATTDFPACLIFEQLMRRFPDAKVVLSTRSSGKAWAQSVLGTIGVMHPILAQKPFTFIGKAGNLAKLMRAVWLMIGAELDPETDLPTEQSLTQAFEAWEAHVRRTVPPQRLLVHQATEGFAPLCEFLGVEECPSKYPNVNDSAQIQATILLFRVITWIWFPVFFVAGISVGWVLRWFRRPASKKGAAAAFFKATMAGKEQ